MLLELRLELTWENTRDVARGRAASLQLIRIIHLPTAPAVLAVLKIFLSFCR